MTVQTAPAAAVSDRPTFSPAAAIGMVLVGVFAFCALVVLFSYAPDLRSGDNGEAHALSRSAIGYAGIVELMKLEGDPVVISHTHLTKDHTEGLLIATPPPGAEKAEIVSLGFGGPVLVVLPKWDAGADPLHKGWVAAATLMELGDSKTALMTKATVYRRVGSAPAHLRSAAAPFAASTALTTGPIQALQSFHAPGWIPVLVDEAGDPILSRDANSEIYVLADPDILNTHGLKDAQTAATASTIIEGLKAGDGPVIFDVTLNGLARERSVLRLLFDPPFLAVTLCLFAAAALAGFQAACRFGAVRRAGRVFALGKEALADNTAALIRLAGREHRMGGRYANLTRKVAAKALGAPRELSGDALTAFLDRLGRQRGVHDTLAELNAVAASVPDRDRLTAVAQKLFRWRLEMTRERQ